MKVIIYLFIISVLILSCSYENIDNSYKPTSSNLNDSLAEQEINEIPDDYLFEEGFIKTDDDINIYYRLFTKENNDGLIVLLHDYDSSLEEWTILLDSFLELNYSLIVYDLRNHGKSQSSNTEDEFFKMKDDLNLIVNFAENKNMIKFKNILFLANGVSGNVALYNSENFCNVNSFFVILTPKTDFPEMPITEFNNYCENSKYLYLYSKKSFENVNKSLYMYNYKNIETLLDNTSNHIGVDLLLNNSIFLFKIKNIINSK